MRQPKKSARAPAAWRWFGSPGHLCVAHDCHFHLCTQVGSYLVSTVGEYIPDPRIPRVSTPRRAGRWQEIGYQRLYETMVFASGKLCDCGCGLPEIDGSELACVGYNTAAAATIGHRALCEEWAAK